MLPLLVSHVGKVCVGFTYGCRHMILVSVSLYRLGVGFYTSMLASSGLLIARIHAYYTTSPLPSNIIVGQLIETRGRFLECFEEACGQAVGMLWGTGLGGG